MNYCNCRFATDEPQARPSSGQAGGSGVIQQRTQDVQKAQPSTPQCSAWRGAQVVCGKHKLSPPALTPKASPSSSTSKHQQVASEPQHASHVTKCARPSKHGATTSKGTAHWSTQFRPNLPSMANPLNIVIGVFGHQVSAATYSSMSERSRATKPFHLWPTTKRTAQRFSTPRFSSTDHSGPDLKSSGALSGACSQPLSLLLHQGSGCWRSSQLRAERDSWRAVIVQGAESPSQFSPPVAAGLGHRSNSPGGPETLSD